MAMDGSLDEGVRDPEQAEGVVAEQYKSPQNKTWGQWDGEWGWEIY